MSDDLWSLVSEAIADAPSELYQEYAGAFDEQYRSVLDLVSLAEERDDEDLRNIALTMQKTMERQFLCTGVMADAIEKVKTHVDTSAKEDDQPTPPSSPPKTPGAKDEDHADKVPTPTLTPSPKRKTKGKAKAKTAAAKVRSKHREPRANKSSATDSYTRAACNERLAASLSHVSERTLNTNGRNFHHYESCVPEAHAQRVSLILFFSPHHGANIIVRLGKANSDVFKVLRTKRLIYDSIRKVKTKAIQEDYPDIQDGAPAADYLNALDCDSCNTSVYDEEIKKAAEDAIMYAVEHKLVYKAGTTDKTNRKTGKLALDKRSILRHYTIIGKEFDALMLVTVSLYSLTNVAAHVELVRALNDEEIHRSAQNLAALQGFESIEGWTVYQYTFCVALPTMAGESHSQYKDAIAILDTAYFAMIGDDFKDVWREHGDQISLPDNEGRIRNLLVSSNYFDDEKKGVKRKRGVVQCFISLSQCHGIVNPTNGMWEHVEELKTIGTAQTLAHRLLRLNVQRFDDKTRRLRDADVFDNDESRENLAKQLIELLQISEERRPILSKSSGWLDLDKDDVDEQIDFLLEMINEPEFRAKYGI